MSIATKNPPIRIRRVAGPAIEVGKASRTSSLATSPPKPASQAKDLGDPTRRYWKKNRSDPRKQREILRTILRSAGQERCRILLGPLPGCTP